MERRSTVRQRTFKGGRINFDTAGVDCIIRNLTDVGACPEADTAVPIPDKFRLVIKPEFLVRDCEVAWRRSDKIGVRFVK